MAESSVILDKHKIQVGIVTVSDSCFEKTKEDKSGPNLRKLIEEENIFDGCVVAQEVVPDELEEIKAVLVSWSDERKLDLILTTGGTGFAPRDVTPEATKAVLEKEALGMSVAMLIGSLDITPLAMLSRLVCGTRKQTLIINLPGSTKGAQECLGFVIPGIPHAVDLLRGYKDKVTATHKTLQDSGPRPPVTKEIFPGAEEVDYVVELQENEPSSGDILSVISETADTSQVNDVGETRELESNILTTISPQSTPRRPGRPRKVATGETDTALTTTTTVTPQPLKRQAGRPRKVKTNLRSRPRTRSLSKGVTVFEEVSEMTATADWLEGTIENVVSQVPETVDISEIIEIQTESESATIEQEICHEVLITMEEDIGNEEETEHRETENREDGVNATDPFYNTSTIERDIALLLAAHHREATPALRGENKENSEDRSRFSEDVSTEERTGQEVSSNRASDSNVYEFTEEGGEINETTLEQSEKTRIAKKNSKKGSKRSKKEILKAKIHKVQKGEEYPIEYVEAGEKLKVYFQNHPAIRGIYLNKGKREIKRRLVMLCRAKSAVDKGSWQRGKHVHERNRLDDLFELSPEGKQKKESIEKLLYRDEYVVNWYLFCPGHGNCRRKCGGFGTCIDGCKGMAHKQDRHNCSLMVNLKMFVSDLSQWRVHITGCHVPIEAPVTWRPPMSTVERLNEDVRDIILSAAEKKISYSDMQQVITKTLNPTTRPSVTPPSKRQISRFVSSLKKRRKERDYNFKDKTQLQDDDDDRVEHSDGSGSDDDGREGNPDCNSSGNHASAYQSSVIYSNGIPYTTIATNSFQTHPQLHTQAATVVNSPTQSQMVIHDQLQPLAQAIPNQATTVGQVHSVPCDAQGQQVIMYEVADQSETTFYYSPMGTTGTLPVHTFVPNGGSIVVPAGSVAMETHGVDSAQLCQQHGQSLSRPLLYPSQSSNLEVIEVSEQSMALLLAAYNQQQQPQNSKNMQECI